MMRSKRVAVAVAGILLLLAEGLAEEEGIVLRARNLRFAGRYGDAEAMVREALSREPGDGAVAAELGEVLLETGRFEEAAALAAGRSGRCLGVAGDALLALGRLGEARALAERVLEGDPDDFRARFLAASVLLEEGRRDEARESFEWFFEKYATSDVTDPEALTLTAAASVRVAELIPDAEMDFKVTMKLLDSITRSHEGYLPAWIVKGDLYLAAYQDQDAKKAYDTALKHNPRYPPALLGLALQRSFRFDDQGGVGRCRAALLTNPNLFAAKEFIARTRIGDSQYDEARKLLAEVLAVNPRRREALALAAAIEYLTGAREAFEKSVARLLELDARYGRVFWEVSMVLEQHRRFAEAASVARLAVKTDPDDFVAHWVLGRNLVHLGEESEAKAALERSRRLDPFAHYVANAFRENMTEVLGHLEEFAESRSEHFVMKIHVGESAVLSRYYLDFMERSWDALTSKYGFEPEHPILAEVFHRHEDFAARTIGLPGIGALGACFGRVITLDSPSARDPGDFSWASTAHHELAHSVTLGLSKGRVPRWFTEGLSVYEERCFADWWGRDMDRDLFDAWHSGEIPRIEDFNAEFRGPRVLFAYYLGGMMCEFIAGEFGFPKIVAMLRAYGEDRQTPEVLRSILGIDPEEYDRRFRAWVGKYVGEFRLTPRWSDRAMRAAREAVADDPRDLESLVRLAQGSLTRGNTVDAMSWLGKALAVRPDDPRLLLMRADLAFAGGRMEDARTRYAEFLGAGGDDLFARINMASILRKEGDRAGAIESLSAAKRCFPFYAGPGNPWQELARLRLEMDDLEGAMLELGRYVKLANTDIMQRMELAGYHESRGDDERLAEVLTEVVWIYPLGEKSAVPVHARLARVLGRLGRHREAAVEFEVSLELGPPDGDRPGLHAELGEVYRLLGRVREARRQAEAALELAPEHEGARRLMDSLTGN
ncbi:MAG: tetratricopeptide repeat protein [Planctomycetes bacterium]|nr:tetratricopeptide repeat protein [Planctomycetota bacterium]